jgi:tetratricopeptide (TPR) repeat protein
MNSQSVSLDTAISHIKKKFSSGQRLQAIEECQRLVHMHPQNIAIRKVLANMYALTGQTAQATLQFKTGFELNPNDEELLFNLAICYRQALSYQEAIQYFLLYTQKFPKNPEGWGSLAECQFQLGDYQSALENSNLALEISPQDARLLSNRSKIYRSLKLFDFALKDATSAKSIDPTTLSYIIETAELIEITQKKLMLSHYLKKLRFLNLKTIWNFYF